MRRINPEIRRYETRSRSMASPAWCEVRRGRVTSALLLIIKDMGVYIKDIDKGLCDFPYLRGGRVVYLCWHLGEERITTWHEIETGFSGREPLDETDC